MIHIIKGFGVVNKAEIDAFLELSYFSDDPMDASNSISCSSAFSKSSLNILESKLKWAVGSIITNKAIGGDGIQVELFQILKDDAVKVLGPRFNP